MSEVDTGLDAVSGSVQLDLKKFGNPQAGILVKSKMHLPYNWTWFSKEAGTAVRA
jgi:hypothetical protein